MARARVSGIGGLFFRARDPAALSRWYGEHLGIDGLPGADESRPWWQAAGATVFAPFSADSGWFGADERQWGINFRVTDLDVMVEQLHAAGIDVSFDHGNPYENGRFADLTDPEGNRIQLWEPAGADVEPPAGA